MFTYLGAIHRITADLKNGLFGDLLGLLARHSAKRDLGLLTGLREKLHQFLQPFVQIVEQVSRVCVFVFVFVFVCVCVCVCVFGACLRVCV